MQEKQKYAMKLHEIVEMNNKLYQNGPGNI